MHGSRLKYIILHFFLSMCLYTDASSGLMPKIQIRQCTMTADVSCYNSAFWMITSLGVLLLGVTPVLYKLQEIKHLLHVHVVMQPVTTKTDLKGEALLSMESTI